MPAYTIKRGDTLSHIAVRFKVPLEALWQMNRRALRSGNKDLIYPGETLKIPMTRTGYDAAIRAIDELRIEFKRDYDANVRDLESITSDYNFTGKAVDFAADIAMIARGATKAAIQYSGAVRQMALRKHLFSALQKTADTLYGELGPAFSDKVIVKATGDAVADQYLSMVEMRRDVKSGDFNKKFGQTVVKEVATKVAGAAVPQEFATDAADAVGIIVAWALEGADKALESVKPSTIARAWIRNTGGEDPEETFRRARQNVKANYDRGDRKLSEIAARLRSDKAAAYPK